MASVTGLVKSGVLAVAMIFSFNSVIVGLGGNTSAGAAGSEASTTGFSTSAAASTGGTGAGTSTTTAAGSGTTATGTRGATIAGDDLTIGFGAFFTVTGFFFAGAGLAGAAAFAGRALAA